MEGGGGGRCFGLDTGLRSRGSIQKNMPARERFGRVLQGLNVQDPTNHERELLLFATPPAQPHMSQPIHSCTDLAHDRHRESLVDTSSSDTSEQHPPLHCCPTPSWGCPPHLELTQFPGTELLCAPLFHASFSPPSPPQHPTPSCPTSRTLSLPQPPLHPVPKHPTSVLTREHRTLHPLQLHPTLCPSRSHPLPHDPTLCPSTTALWAEGPQTPRDAPCRSIGFCPRIWVTV